MCSENNKYKKPTKQQYNTTTLQKTQNTSSLYETNGAFPFWQRTFFSKKKQLELNSRFTLLTFPSVSRQEISPTPCKYLMVDMNRKLLLAPIAVLLGLSVVIILIHNQSSAVGVNEGDSFTHYMGADYTSTASNSTVQIPQFEANNTDWVQIDITGVSADVITSVYTLHYKNVTEQHIDGQTGISQNIWNFSHIEFKGVPIIPANLNAGDKASSLDLTINESTTRMCLGEERQLNHITWFTELERGDCTSIRQQVCLWTCIVPMPL
jgi:hypothetical protein